MMNSSLGTSFDVSLGVASDAVKWGGFPFAPRFVGTPFAKSVP